MKTTLPKHELKHTSKVWHLIDATGMTLGRLATDIAMKLQGKHKPWYVDMRDCGDYVVVINVEKIVVTGKKVTDKMYYTHTGYKGHLTELTYAQMIAKDPCSVLELAVKGMLPKNKTRLHRLKRLKLHVGAEHAYAHQLTQSEQLKNKTFAELNK
jgi:large subunit ribosomal protein L13